MFNNNYNYGQYGQPVQGGMQYQQPQIPNMTQGLTANEIAELRKDGGNQFKVNVSPREMLITKCTHKDKGNIVLTDNADGTATCQICGETFRPAEYTVTDVEELTTQLNDALQSIKTYYLDMPENIVREFMPVIALIKKIPKLYEIAINNFSKYDTGIHNQMNSPYGWNMLSSIMGGAPMQAGMGMQGGYPQPGYGYPQQPQQGYGYPQQGGGYGYPQQPQQMGGNPLSYQGDPSQAVQPQAQQPANGAPANGDAAISNTKVFDV